MTEPWNWTKDDLEKLIGQMESLRLDFKESILFELSNEKIAENLSREVSAFANTEGGTIVVGIKERKEGRSRIADKIDSGVDLTVRSPESIQQLLESNVRPYLTGLRVRTIMLDEEYTHAAIVICVPAGTTAYQARDNLYYGRSEYESKSLPDHEIRLRMFRGQKASATLRVVLKEHYTGASSRTVSDSPRDNDSTPSTTERIGQSAQFDTNTYVCEVYLVNTGEINISEFKLRLDFPDNNRFRLSRRREFNVKDGWIATSDSPESAFLHERMRSMKVNIYPSDSFRIGQFNLPIKAVENITEQELLLQWSIYLKDTLPIHGSTDVIEQITQPITPNESVN